MKGKIIGVKFRDDFTNSNGQTFAAAVTFYVLRKLKEDNSIGEMGDEIKLSRTNPEYNTLLLGTDTFEHALGAVVDYSYDASSYGRKLADFELVSYINADGEVIKYNDGEDDPALYEPVKQKTKASA
ncbi:MAG: hypothetical protein LBM59_04060 [Ruminococcus sp.]|jgi:hypothetical protein|nr:hypothetical protein [Ruminococcus sp.]